MHASAHPHVKEQLARLELFGRRYLVRQRRREAWRFASEWAALVAFGTALSMLALALALPIGMWTPIVAVLGASFATLLGGYALKLRGPKIERFEALKLFDALPDFRNRITTSAEFLQSSSGDGFRQAALAEAEPWLSAALAQAAEVAAAPARRSSLQWLFLLGAALALIASLFVSRGAAVGPDVARQILHAIAAVAPVKESARADLRDARLPLGERDRAAPASRAVTPLASAAAGRGSATVTGRGDPAERSAAAEAGEGGAAPAAAAARADGLQDSPGSRQQGSGGTAGQPNGPSSAPNSARAMAPLAAGLKGEGNRSVTASQPPRAQMTGAMPMPSAPSRAPVSQQSPSSPKGGTQNGQPNGQGGGQSGRGKNQQQNQASPGMPGRGSGRGTGQDAIKRMRGSSALLLAVPMEDRLIGTPGPGRVDSSRRAVPPHAAPATAATAQDRGRQNGNAGEILHRADGPHETRMLRNFFRRGRPGAGQ